MFWLVYIFTAALLSHFVASIKKKNYFIIFMLVFMICITPAQIQIQTNYSDYAPSVFVFIFNILLEKDFSTRVLRPLLITIPLTFIFLLLFNFLKRKFFES